MKRWLKRLSLCIVILLIMAGLTYGASEYLFKSVSSSSMSEEPALDISSVKGEDIENANGTINEAYGKQCESITKITSNDPNIVKDIPTSNRDGYSSSGRASSGGINHSYDGSPSLNGSSSGDYIPPDGDYWVEIDFDDRPNNICHDCGTRYYGTGICPNPDCPTNKAWRGED